MRRKIFSAIFILTILLCVPLAASAEIIDSGNCGAPGNNVTWTLDDEGTLTISGEGDMKDYHYSYDTPWYYSCSSIKRVVIEQGVTSIGSDAFFRCGSLTSVTIPDSVTSIGELAFYYCSNSTSVTIPDSVTTIGDYAFEYCSGLTSIIIPNSVTNIGNLVFSRCDNLTSVAIGVGLESIGTTPFYACNSLTSVNYNASKVFSNIFDYNDYYNEYNNILLIVLGDNVKSIDTNAFTDCANLKRIIIPKSVTEMEKAAFADCKSLTTVEYGGSKADWEEIYIGVDNENLENANIIFNSSLSNTTLTDLDYLTYTVNEDNTVTITNCYENATKINIPKEIDGKPVTAINASAFANRTKLTSVTIPESVTSIGSARSTAVEL